MNLNAIIGDVVTYGPMLVTAAAAATAVLPQTGPAWWVAVRQAIDVLALNVGYAKNAQVAK